MNPITQVLKESEDRNRLGQLEVATWMRGYGVDDDDEFNPGEVEEMLDLYRGEINLAIKKDQTSLLSAIIKEIEGMKYFFKREKGDYLPDVYKHLKSKNEARDEIQSLLNQSLQELQGNS